MTKDRQSDPPSWLQPPLFMIGQDGRGNWVVQDRTGKRGGLFVSREAALRYVRSENGFGPRAVVMVSGDFELDLRCCSPRIRSVATSRHRLARPASRW
jgi:hypothetical protein